MAAKTLATPADVRTWAKSQDLPAGGSRGLLPQATIDAFNAAHKSERTEYVPGAEQTREVSVKPEKGRTIVRKVLVSEVRAFWTSQGHAARGRLPEAAFREFVLSQPVKVKAPKPSEV